MTEHDDHTRFQRPTADESAAPIDAMSAPVTGANPDEPGAAPAEAMPAPPANDGAQISPLLLLGLLPLLGLVAALAMLMTAAGNSPTTNPPTPAPVTLPPAATQVQLSNQPAPEFTAALLDGGTTSLADYRGRVVFLNFWATWCEPCQRELPAFEQFTAEHTEPDAPIVLAVNWGETDAQARDYLAEREITGLTILLDGNYQISDQYGVGALPVTYVVDSTGVIRATHYGEMTAENLSNYLTTLGS